MAVFNFPFPYQAAGLDVTVKNTAGNTVDAGTVGARVGSSRLDIVHQSTLAGDEEYTASVESPLLGGVFEVQGELDVPASIADAPSGGETDGVGAMFFGGFGLNVGLDGVKVYTDFVPNDEPPRAPNRDDLIMLDPEDEDNKTLLVTSTGATLYDISLNVPIGPANVNFVPETPVEIHGFVVFEVNGEEGEYPITAYNNHAWWKVSEAGFQPPVTLSLTFPQVLVAGDTIQLGFKAIQDHHDDDPLNGNLALVPDITLLMTPRGPVTLPEA